MNTQTSFRTLLEKIEAANEVVQIKLPVSEKSLAPVVSGETMELHYGTLYKNYVKKALAGEGKFQVAGAKLHTLFFEQFQEPAATNNPSGQIKLLIDKTFGDYKKFKESFTETALSLHGSGWVYLTTSGSIKVIHNHELVDDVAVILDMWEHSFIIDYGADKEKYLKNMWKIINWDIINVRLN